MEKKLYRNRKWLELQYSKKSGNRIAKERGVNVSTIRKWLHRFNIKIRSQSEAVSLATSNHVNLTEEALEFLVGNLLGDGHLSRQSKVSAWYENGSKFRSYLEWLSSLFTSYGIEQLGKIYEGRGKLPGRDKTYIGFYYASRHYCELKELHNKWYRKAKRDEKYKTGRQRKWIKILPTDLKLTQLVCRQWYLGDGHLGHSSRSSYIEIATGGFGKVAVERLVAMLKKLGFVAARCKDKKIYISTKSTKDFLDYIGPCPVKCYEYKWKVK